MAAKKSADKNEKNFFWTDEETALLLRILIDYKASKALSGLDWETIKNRYDEITDRFRLQYPKPESGSDPDEYPNMQNILQSEYPNMQSVFNKDCVNRKLKRVKMLFRKAIDSGRRSSGGRVVMTLYDEYYEVWSGWPAVESIPEGLESSV
ncbi:MAG: hypothetical protein GY823_12930 [Flavobacteriaceae bacterium]|nr:hypothetical protein [Flavobacteriaceae bacterium]